MPQAASAQGFFNELRCFVAPSNGCESCTENQHQIEMRSHRRRQPRSRNLSVSSPKKTCSFVPRASKTTAEQDEPKLCTRARDTRNDKLQQLNLAKHSFFCLWLSLETRGKLPVVSYLCFGHRVSFFFSQVRYTSTPPPPPERMPRRAVPMQPAPKYPLAVSCAAA